MGDVTIDDAFDPAAQWDGYETDSFDALGAHPGLPADLAPLVSSFTAGSSGTGAVNVRPVVTFTEAVTAAPGAFTLTCTTSGSVAVTAVSSDEGRSTRSTPPGRSPSVRAAR